jgi:streptogramin lyase
MIKQANGVRLGVLWLLLSCLQQGAYAAPYNTYSVNDMVIAPDGTVWTTDVVNNRIQHRKADGSVIAQFGRFGKGAGQFDAPTKIALSTDGSVWIADGRKISSPHFGDLGLGDYYYSYRLQHLKADGTFIFQMGSEGTDLDQFFGITDIATAVDGSVWVADGGNHRIQHFNADGSLIVQFKYEGTLLGQCNCSFNVAPAADGSIWVADENDGGVQHYTANGQVVGKLVSQNDNGLFWRPQHIVVAADGSVWVVDNYSSRLQHFQADGLFMARLGGYGEAGLFNNYALSTDGNVWVVDGNKGILKFDPQDTLPQTLFPAEYNDQQAKLYLHDVEIDDQHYEVVLQKQNGRYVLVSASVASKYYNSPAWFYDNKLTIPLVKAFGQNYQATLKQLGNNVFELLEATLK